jgi:predicted pyridoxine 5'-phosphate oxidase superfamily flavin-nucleotide-binding protein
MKRPISDIAFTSAVKQAQEKRGSRKAYARMEQQDRQGPWQDIVTSELAEFIGARDSLYLGTAGADGQPHVQHRGGPKGFIKVLDEHTLALADFAGNAQYISLGNLSENNKAFIFLMDYPNRLRVKIWGTARFIEGDPVLLTKVVDTTYEARPERVLLFHVKAWSPNCTQHIQQRFTDKEMAPRIQKLEGRIAELEEINASLVKQLGQSNPKPVGRKLPDLAEAPGS